VWESGDAETARGEHALTITDADRRGQQSEVAGEGL